MTDLLISRICEKEYPMQPDIRDLCEDDGKSSAAKAAPRQTNTKIEGPFA
jgi:hypothetical protein